MVKRLQIPQEYSYRAKLLMYIYSGQAAITLFSMIGWVEIFQKDLNTEKNFANVTLFTTWILAMPICLLTFCYQSKMRFVYVFTLITLLEGVILFMGSSHLAAIKKPDDGLGLEFVNWVFKKAKHLQNRKIVEN